MRAAIEHQGRYGVLGFKPRFTLYLCIEFTNEERAIVSKRALQNYVFDLSPGYLATTESRFSPHALSAMTAGGFAIFWIGFLLIFAAIFINFFGAIATACLFGGPFLFWYGVGATRRERSAYTKQLTLGYLLKHPTISVQADNPAFAATIEDNLRKRLVVLKYFLTDTHQLTTLRSFEM
jgi:hypothetical protein